MSIPKKLHYCFFGKETDMPEKYKECIKSWKEYLPDYELVLWDRSCYDLMPKYAKDALNSGNYAVASDWVRIYSLYTQGGIYFDCDVKVNKTLPNYLNSSDVWFVGRDYNHEVCGEIMGAKAGNKFFKYILDWFESTTFIPDRIYLAPRVFGNLLSMYLNVYIKKDTGNDMCVRNFYKENETIVIYPYKLFNSSKGYCQHLSCASWVSSSTIFMNAIPEFFLKINPSLEGFDYCKTIY